MFFCLEKEIRRSGNEKIICVSEQNRQIDKTEIEKVKGELMFKIDKSYQNLSLEKLRYIGETSLLLLSLSSLSLLISFLNCED